MNACGSFGAALIALLIALAPASEACAHASLVKAVPADGAVMPLPPATLTLTFNEPVSPLVVRLIGPDGAPIAPPRSRLKTRRSRSAHRRPCAGVRMC